MRTHIPFLVLATAVSFIGVGFDGTNMNASAKNRQHDFVIAGSDGYGTQECLVGKGRCGQVVADAWCESKGFKGAVAYRKLDADEITGSASSSSTAGKPMESFLVSCRE